MTIKDSNNPGSSENGSRLGAKAWLRALEATAQIPRRPQRTLPVLIGELAARYGGQPALVSEHETLTFEELAALSNRYARWALTIGIARGECVALMLPNSVNYMPIWLGITAIGGVCALVNVAVTGRSLAHCLETCGATRVIVAPEFTGALEAAHPFLSRPITTWVHGDAKRDVDAQPGHPLRPSEHRDVAISDLALFIFTSGTTGLPKAARLSHQRILTWCLWFSGMMGIEPSDRMYNCLPMYHSIGGVAAMGAALVGGASVFVRDGFSASRFWEEIVAHDCTLFQYIGELCRYLVNQPSNPMERQHRLRLCCGNGLSAGVWRSFQERFAVPEIFEFYASTEGNVTLYNVEGRVGSIGRLPGFLRHRSTIALVRFDPESGEPLRDQRGFCLRAETGETGHALGRIGADGEGRFEGYSSAEDTAKKILRDAFEPGDAWFCTGDLMRRDTDGFYHFVDRIGDTFRWKGENVATTEVAAVIARCAGVLEVNVYGVTVPNTEGRAGMAALVVDKRFAIPSLRKHMAENLPLYARPLFLRLCQSMRATATFKPQKQDLAREGFDPGVIKEPLYFLAPDGSEHMEIDAHLYKQIIGGEFHL